jgi:hypothetical protein
MTIFFHIPTAFGGVEYLKGMAGIVACGPALFSLNHV